MSQPSSGLVNWEGDWNPFPVSFHPLWWAILPVWYTTGYRNFKYAVHQAARRHLEMIEVCADYYSHVICAYHFERVNLDLSSFLKYGTSESSWFSELSLRWNLLPISWSVPCTFLVVLAITNLPCYPLVTDFLLLSTDCRKASCCQGNWTVRNSLFYMTL